MDARSTYWIAIKHITGGDAFPVYDPGPLGPFDSEEMAYAVGVQRLVGYESQYGRDNVCFTIERRFLLADADVEDSDNHPAPR